MHYGDNEFDEEYSDLDEEQFNEMHGFCNDPGHGCLNPDHDTLHCGDDTDYDWSDIDTIQIVIVRRSLTM